MHVVGYKWLSRAVVLVGAALGVEPALAEDDPIAMRIGVRTGVESSSSVTLSQQSDREALLMLGVDADTFSGPFVLGGGLSAAVSPPFGHAALRAGAHGGVDAQTPELSASATLGMGMQWLDSICPKIFREDPCGSAVLPFAELRGAVGHAWEHVEVSVWAAFLVDIGREHVTSGGNDYDVGGTTFAGGLTVAYLARR